MKILLRLISTSILVSTCIGLFSAAAIAQSGENGAALKTIAGIVASLNHFPSDADKATLSEIAGNDNLAQGVRAMARTFSNISHSANDQGKAAMARIQENAQAPDYAKQLAGIIAGINHTASNAEKATLAELFQ